MTTCPGTSISEIAETVAEELRALAAAHMRGERGSHTLQPTALVNEVWVRIIESERADLGSRAAFIRYASAAMRNILIDHARRRNALKRGEGGTLRLGDGEPAVVCGDPATDDELLALHEALRVLEAEHPRAAKVVEMRFFGGATNREAAEALGVALRTVEKDWTAARAWLRGRLDGRGPPDSL